MYGEFEVKIYSFIAFFIVMSMSLAVQAESKADATTSELASILLKMEFYPNLKEKRFLKNVSMDESNTESQRTIAAVLRNVQHKPLYSDLAKLEKILNDKKATAPEQEIAYIIHRLKYRPRLVDKQTLKRIIN